MSSFDALRELDATLLDAFVDTDLLADAGTYNDTTHTAVPVRVLIDRDVQRLGEYGQITGTDTQVGVYLGDVQPVQGGVITVGSAAWTLGRRVAGDASIEWWSVTR